MKLDENGRDSNHFKSRYCGLVIIVYILNIVLHMFSLFFITSIFFSSKSLPKVIQYTNDKKGLALQKSLNELAHLIETHTRKLINISSPRSLICECTVTKQTKEPPQGSIPSNSTVFPNLNQNVSNQIFFINY